MAFSPLEIFDSPWMSWARHHRWPWSQPVPDAPEGYPHELVQVLRSKDGQALRVRPILPADADRLRQALAAQVCSSETLYRRFGTGCVKLTESQLRYLTNLDYQDNLALVVEHPDGEHGIAIARYHATGREGVAEPAMIIADEWQGRGIGRQLLAALMSAARERGVKRFEALVQADNERMLWILDTGPFSAEIHTEGGEATVTIPLGH